MDSYIVCARKTDGDKFGGRVGPVSYLAVPEGEVEPNTGHRVASSRQWLDAVAQRARAGASATTTELDVVFFVHGYNTDPVEALKRQRLVERELAARDYQCVVIGFDWPTAGTALAYAYDRFVALDAAAYLVKGGIIPFSLYSAKDCAIKVHVMAHSMGGFVVREAFRSMDKGRDATLSNDWRIGQLVLFGADVSSGCFTLGNSDMIPVFEHCGRLTNYFSGHDEALAVSNVKNLDINSRVGRVGMPIDTPAHEKALDVDCGPRYTAVPKRQFKVINGMTSHSWYLEDEIWLNDLAYTLAGKIDRNVIPTRKFIAANDFTLNGN